MGTKVERMDRGTIEAGLLALNSAFGGQKTASEIRSLSHFWFDAFADVNPGVFNDAIKKAIQSEQFFPVIVNVRGYIEDIQRRRDAQAPKAIEHVHEKKIPSRAWVRALLREKGLIDDKGEWIDPHGAVKSVFEDMSDK